MQDREAVQFVMCWIQDKILVLYSGMYNGVTEKAHHKAYRIVTGPIILIHINVGSPYSIDMRHQILN
jgi:hypothetical protein